MKTLLVAATKAEIAPFIEKNEADVDVLITGVGMVATAFALGASLNQKNYDLVVNAGIAGSYNRKWKLGEVVEVCSEQIADFGAEEADGYFLSAFDMGLVDGNSFPFVDNEMVNRRQSSFPSARGLTVNLVHGTAKHIKISEERYAADVETMEGAAVFFACLQQEVPFIALRAISNYVEPRNRTAWDIPIAIKALNKVLVELL